jgi:hypothetical protein
MLMNQFFSALPTIFLSIPKRERKNFSSEVLYRGLWLKLRNDRFAKDKADSYSHIYTGVHSSHIYSQIYLGEKYNSPKSQRWRVGA